MHDSKMIDNILMAVPLRVGINLLADQDSACDGTAQHDRLVIASERSECGNPENNALDCFVTFGFSQ